MDKLLKLQTPSEQSRLLNEIPEVIADIVEPEPGCEDSTRKDQNEDWDSLPESAHRRASKNPAWNLKSSSLSCRLNDSTDTAGYTPVFAYQISVIVRVTVFWSSLIISNGIENEHPCMPKYILLESELILF